VADRTGGELFLSPKQLRRPQETAHHISMEINHGWSL